MSEMEVLVERLRVVRDALREDRGYAASVVADAVVALAVALDRFAVLKAALEPFADYGDEDDDYTDDERAEAHIGRTILYLKLGDLRRARAALSSSGEPE